MRPCSQPRGSWHSLNGRVTLLCVCWYWHGNSWLHSWCCFHRHGAKVLQPTLQGTLGRIIVHTSFRNNFCVKSSSKAEKIGILTCWRKIALHYWWKKYITGLCSSWSCLSLDSLQKCSLLFPTGACCSACLRRGGHSSAGEQLGHVPAFLPPACPVGAVSKQKGHMEVPHWLAVCLCHPHLIFLALAEFKPLFIFKHDHLH